MTLCVGTAKCERVLPGVWTWTAIVMVLQLMTDAEEMIIATQSQSS